MKLQRALKTRLDLTPVQASVLARHGSAARFVYNWGLERRSEHYKVTGKGLTYPQQNKALTQLKVENAWLYEVSKWVGQDALRRLDTAFGNFFRDAKKVAKRKIGYPQFKKKARQNDSFQFPAWNGAQPLVKIEGKKICLPKIGWLKCYEIVGEKIPADAKLLSATVSQEGPHWDVSLCYEFEYEAPVHDGPAIGVDLGVKTLATLSDGTAFENPRHLKHSQKVLKRLQRWHSRKEKGSQNKQDSRLRLAKWHGRVANQRKDALHKLTTSLAQAYSVVCIEDLNVSGMVKNHNLATALSDCGFAEFRRQLEYKCPYYGGAVVVINRWFPSSKTCSACGVINESLMLKTRTWRCDCGVEHDRD